MKKKCTFCDISNGICPAHIIYEDETIIAFLDIDPISEGHTLIIPKKHIKDIYLIDSDTAGKIIVKAAEIGIILKKVFGFDGVSIMENNDVFQDVHHFHLHVYGRRVDDDVNFEWPKYKGRPPEELTSLIKKNLE